MTAYRNVNGTFRACPAIYTHVGGAWHRVTNAWRNVGGTWRQFFVSALTMSINPSTASASAPRGGTLTTNSMTASASGGSGNYTYAWTMMPGSDSRIIITSPSSATTTFRATLTSGDGASGTAICTATDTSTNVTGQVQGVVQMITGGGGGTQ